MPRRKLSRIGLLIALAGFALLGASLSIWTLAGPDHRLFYTEDEHQWVRADASSAPAVATDELWRVGAACQRPYFAAAAEQAKANLEAFGDTAPDEVRAWRRRPQQQQQANERQQADAQQHADAARAEADDDFKLHGKYQDWFLAELRLQKELQQWQRRLGAVGDRSTTFTAARERIRDIRVYVSEDPELAGAGRDFEHFVYFVLGLGGFPDEALNAIKATCIDIAALKLIVTGTAWHTDIRQWPHDEPVTFWPGPALAVLGLALIALSLRRRRRA